MSNIYNNNIKSISYRLAFTLAEVLITLGIIGIVAEMTIPSLISDYKKTVYVTQLKKAYTTFNQAMYQMLANSGCIDQLSCLGLTTNQNFGDEIVKYFKVLKNCGSTKGEGCMASKINYNYDGTSALTQDLDNYSFLNFYSFVALDGTSYAIESWNNCASGFSGKTYISKVCSWVYIDVNGPSNGPNYYGRDLYAYFITNGKGPILYPYGGMEWQGLRGYIYWRTDGYCQTGNTDGTACAGRIMEDGWSMKY